MAWTECEIDEVLEQTIRTLRDSGDTAGGVNLTVPAAELSKENMDALGDLIVEHARRQADPGYTGSSAEVPGTGQAFTIVDHRAIADDGVEYVATFVDVTAAEDDALSA
ncbi:hypothetical protein GS467_18620 [Rhodococcus hoagii]|nr:hypothetical protein [Prescottella equi]NKR60874.1 hypothetical protein [Prescottella equi]NKR68386.1 hypothetical protein [Prescottella equi]NKS23211.1 hypothetical protein [Prescottella equi]